MPKWPARYIPKDVHPSKMSTAWCDEVIARVLADPYYMGRLNAKIKRELSYRSARMRKNALDAVAHFEGLLEHEGYFGPAS